MGTTDAHHSAVRLVSRPADGRDGLLGVVDEQLGRVVAGPAPTLQQLLEHWDQLSNQLAGASASLSGNGGSLAQAVEIEQLLAPLPRAVQYCEGSTYLSHMRRCRAARGAQMPADVLAAPAVLQGASDRFLAPNEPIVLADPEWGLDLECTLAAVVDDVPQGVSAEVAAGHIRLFMLANDLTLRNVLRREGAVGVGFFQAKPLRVFAPVAVTPEVLGSAWDGHLVSLRVSASVNGEWLGTLDSGLDAAFDFGEVIAHAARTRPLSAGTIVGTGTISNENPAAGFGCLAEKRALEILNGDQPSRYLQSGDTLRIEARDQAGTNIFGTMENSIITPNGERP